MTTLLREKFGVYSVVKPGSDLNNLTQSVKCVIPDGVLIQVGPPDDEHLLLETCRGVEINTLKKSASSWSLTRITSRCTVNKT